MCGYGYVSTSVHVKYKNELNIILCYESISETLNGVVILKLLFAYFLSDIKASDIKLHFPLNDEAFLKRISRQ